MHLTYRPASAQDIEACLEMLPPEFVCTPDLRAKFPDAWRQWLREGILQVTVIEDGCRRVAFGSSVFITEAFAEEAKTTLSPYLSAHVVARWSEERSPILDLNALRAANSGPGLHLLMLHIGWLLTLAAEEIRWVKTKLLEAMLFTHGGYRLEEVLQEIYSEEERQRGQAAGALVKNDYSAYYRANPEAVPPPEGRPYLIGGSREEISDGSYLSPLFFYTPPRFFFKSGEQEILRLALLDRSDAEMSQAFSISASAVQKRWRAIYERVASVQPDFFPAGSALSDAAATRGAEKRRHLVSYLRAHLEELRPVRPRK